MDSAEGHARGAVETVLTITVVSDTVCPWCFIGKRRLESAIAELCAEWPNVACTLQWAPYFLTPGRPPKPRNKLNGYVKRLGNEKTTAMVAMMQQLGEKESPPIRFSYGGDIADTLDSHRLLDWALETYGADVQARVVEALSTRYFERELSVGDHTVLVDAAREGGAEAEAAKIMLQDANDAAVRGEKLRRQAREIVESHAVAGVPHYVVSTPHGTAFSIPGAQDTAVFLRALRRILQVHDEAKQTARL